MPMPMSMSMPGGPTTGTTQTIWRMHLLFNKPVVQQTHVTYPATSPSLKVLIINWLSLMLQPKDTNRTEQNRPEDKLVSSQRYCQISTQDLLQVAKSPTVFNSLFHSSCSPSLHPLLCLSFSFTPSFCFHCFLQLPLSSSPPLLAIS